MVVQQRIPNQIQETQHAASSSVRAENIQFEDNVGLQSINVSHTRDDTFKIGMETNVGLNTFLERPVFLTEVTWTAEMDGDTHFKQWFDPWKLWQANTHVADKLKNYAYVSFDLTVRFMYNGSPFQYGKMMVNYVPYGEDYEDIIPGGSNEHHPERYRNSMAAAAFEALHLTATSGSPEIFFRYFSTYPTTYLDPAGNEVIEMKIPFLWHKNAFATAGGESCGVILMTELAPLWIANTNAPTELNISVYAMASNIKLGVPTQLVTPFANITEDEYDLGPVSAPATAVAQMAGKLERAPVIGRLARATRIGANAVGGIGKLLGFSTPHDGTPNPVYQRSAGRMAEVIGTDISQNLALDPKQELSVDPRQLFSDKDEMLFKEIISREQFIARAWWTKATGQFTAPNTKTLFSGLVNPSLISRTGNYVVSANTFQLMMDTPGGRLSRMFAYWRGSIIFRVEVVCTSMHKGRLLLTFDPNYTATTNANQIPTSSVNTRYTVVFDIAKGKSQEFKIDYNSLYPYLRQKQSITTSTFKPTRNTDTSMDVLTAYDPGADLGLFTVEIMNELTAPISTNGVSGSHAPAQVLVWMRCGDDMEFCQPSENATPTEAPETDPGWGSYFYLPYATIFENTEGDEVATMDINPQKLDSAANNFFGEAVVSARLLVKRYTMVMVGDAASNDASANAMWFMQRNVPFYSHLPITGKTRRHTYQSYLAPMYLLRRGSTRWKLFPMWLPASGSTSNGLATYAYGWMQRESYYGSSPPNTVISGLLCSSASSAQMTAFVPGGYNGCHMANGNTEPFMNAQLPFYSNSRFDLAVNPLNVGSSSGEPLVQNATMNQILYGSFRFLGAVSNASANPGSQIVHYFATGDDFTLSFFLAPPVVYVWTAN